jgi:NADH dehydrogenase
MPPDPLNFVIVGGGPTGVELAGALSEIARKSLARDFRAIDPKRARVVLVEAAPRVLPTYPEDLSREAQRELEGLGVEVHTGVSVTAVSPGCVRIGDTPIPAAVTLWAAGVAASPVGRQLGVATNKHGQVPVGPDLSLSGRPEVFVIGDLAAATDEAGHPLPGLAAVATQEGKYVAQTIGRDLAHEPRRRFHYVDKGILATIGRAAAVASFGKIHLTGLVAWLSWLFIHLMLLIGFRNRLLVLVQWAWSYLTYQRGIRLITGSTDLPRGRCE